MGTWATVSLTTEEDDDTDKCSNVRLVLSHRQGDRPGGCSVERAARPMHTINRPKYAAAVEAA